MQKLLSINRQFYQTFAEAFDATRQRIQPGVERVLTRVLDRLPHNARILDLGCGNGELARELAQRGFEGEYVGVDFSEGLVEKASGGKESGIGNQESAMGRFTFLVADLTSSDWDAGLDGPFEVVWAFAVFHHLPSPFHSEILRKVHRLLTWQHPERNGRNELRGFGVQSKDATNSSLLPFSSSPFPLFVLSNWQFLNSPRWTARIQPWTRAGLTADQVEPNDYLLDWRRGGEGLRYVHHFSEPELAALAEHTEFEVVERFMSDGAEGNLGLYQIWRPI